MTGVAAGAVRIDVRAPAGALLAWPNPPPVMGLQISDVETEDLFILGEAQSNFGRQRAYVARVTGPAPSMKLSYSDFGSFAPDWAWSPPDGSLNRPSTELEALVNDVASGLDGQARVVAIMCHVGSVFCYGHGEGRFTDGAQAVPALSCGLTRGSCVDIHTYAVAALRAGGIDAAYCAGVFWRAGTTTFDDMHCWIVVGGQAPSVWDISHALIAGRPVEANLEAVAGRRFPLALGRDITYRWRGENWRISHFAEPHILAPDGVHAHPADTTFTLFA